MLVEFVLTNPLLVAHFGPVMRALHARGHEARFVSVPPPRWAGFDLRRKAALHEQMVASAGRAGLPCARRITAKANVAITALASNELQFYTCRKLKFRYGVGFFRHGFHYNAAMSRGFDGVLVHGAFERDLFARWIDPVRIKLMGYPMFDAHVLAPTPKVEARRMLGLDAASGSRVIAYLPTWSHLSSLRPFARPMLDLARKATVVVKPHALSRFDATDRAALKALRAAGARVVHPATPLPIVVTAADLTIADAVSGATPESVLLAPDTPIVLLATRPVQELFDEIALAGPVIGDSGALASEIDRLGESDEYVASRRELANRLFDRVDGHCAERAVNGIEEIARMPKVSASPLLIERLFPWPAQVIRSRSTALRVASVRFGNLLGRR